MNLNTKIISGCRRGNERAYRQLYENTIGYTYSIVSRYISDADRRKDITQEVYASVFQHFDQYDEKKAPFKGWLRRIAINTCLMQFRSNKLKVYNSEINEEDYYHEDHMKLNDLTREDIESFLKNMPEGYRTIFMLYVMDGYKHKEISELLDIDIQTSRSQLSRAKRWVRTQLIDTNKSENYGILRRS